MVGFLLGVAVGVGVSTGLHVGVRGGNIYEVVGWSALTGGISAALVRKGFYTGAWAGVRATGAYLAPPAWIVLKDIAHVAWGTTKLIVKTPTAKAVGKGGGALAAGYVIGAAAGTGIVYVAEEKGIVYEGATSDVIDFYTGSGEYWGDYDWKGTPTTDDPGRPGYFNAPGNIGIIAEHVKHGHYFGH